MSQPLLRRMPSLSLCTSCAARINRSKPITRPFSTTHPYNLDTRPPPPSQPAKFDPSDLFNPVSTGTNADALRSIFGDFPDSDSARTLHPQTTAEDRLKTTYHLHVLATKHNTHITLTRPDRSPLLSLSTGNISFRKANRGTYDAAYQLASYVLGAIQERGWMKDIECSEVVLRGFGVGREAVTKCLLGAEGRIFRGTVIRVADHTRIKFGGTRSEKPRRLG